MGADLCWESYPRTSPARWNVEFGPELITVTLLRARRNKFPWDESARATANPLKYLKDTRGILLPLGAIWKQIWPPLSLGDAFFMHPTRA